MNLGKWSKRLPALLISAILLITGVIAASPEYNDRLHTDYMKNTTYWLDGQSHAYTGQPFTASGKTGVTYYYIDTALTADKTFTLTADVTTEQVNAFWAGVRLVLRAGTNGKGANGEIYVLLRDEGIYLFGTTGGDHVLASNYEIKRELGRTYHITAVSAPDSVSVWVDGQPVFENISLQLQDDVDFTDMPVNVRLCFAHGSGDTDTVSRVENLHVFDDTLPEQYPHDDQTSYQDSMTVTRNGSAFAYDGSQIVESDTGTIAYDFAAPVSDDAYYFQAKVQVENPVDPYARPLLFFRGNGSTRVGLAFRGNGTYIVNQNIMGLNRPDGTSSWANFNFNANTEYRVTIYSTKDKVWVWINGKAVYAGFDLQNSSSGDYAGLPADPSLKVVQGNGSTVSTMRDIAIWDDKLPCPVYDQERHTEYAVGGQYWVNTLPDPMVYDGGSLSESGNNGAATYYFPAPMGKNATYVMKATVTTPKANVFWAGVRMVTRAGRNAAGTEGEIYFMLRGEGAYIFGTDGSQTHNLAARFDLTRQQGRAYDITIKSSPDAMWVWVDGQLIFDNIPMLYEQAETVWDHSGMPANPRLVFAHGDGETESVNIVDGLRIFHNAQTDNDWTPEELVTRQVEALVLPVTQETAQSVRDARQAYEQLSDEQKALVSNLEKLLQAEYQLYRLEGVIGDLNGDQALNILDVVLIKRNLAGLDTFDSRQKALADRNGDGVVNGEDLMAVKAHILKQ